MMAGADGFGMSRIPELRFGPGKIQDALLLLREYSGTVLIVTGAASFRLSESYARLLESLRREKIRFLEFRIPHEPDVEILEMILKEIRPQNVGSVLAIGGGSVLDAGKALSLLVLQKGNVELYLEKVGDPALLENRKIPCIAVPTTAGTGSEATRNAVITVPARRIKVSLRHHALIPEHVILDPALQLSLPRETASASGMDALTQLLESYCSSQANPMTDALALEGILLVRHSFVQACLRDNPDEESKGKMSLAAYYSGIALANAGLGLVHGFAGLIGGATGLPHGRICGTLMLPVMESVVGKARREERLPFLRKWDRLRAVWFGASSQCPDDDESLFGVWRNWRESCGMSSFPTRNVHEQELRTWARQADNKNALVALDEQERLSILFSVFKEVNTDG
jgi:alcohol dehydrogenase class IV